MSAETASAIAAAVSAGTAVISIGLAVSARRQTGEAIGAAKASATAAEGANTIATEALDLARDAERRAERAELRANERADIRWNFEPGQAPPDPTAVDPNALERPATVGFLNVGTSAAHDVTLTVVIAEKPPAATIAEEALERPWTWAGRHFANQPIVEPDARIELDLSGPGREMMAARATASSTPVAIRLPELQAECTLTWTTEAGVDAEPQVKRFAW